MSSSYPTLRRLGMQLPSRMRASTHEGAGFGRRGDNWHAPSTGPITTSAGSLQTLRNRSRKATRDDPWGRQGVERLTSNHIGCGILPRPLYPDDNIRADMSELWADSISELDADGLLDFYGLQALVARTFFAAGEAFVRIRPRTRADELAVPLQFQVVEPEMVPLNKNERLPNGNRIRQGIEFNGVGKRVAYWMHKSHPGESLPDGDATTLVRVPAEYVMHVFEPERPGQIRGVPHLSAALLRMKTLDDYDDAVLFRQEVANLFTGFVKRPSPESNPLMPDIGSGDYAPMATLEPGTMQELMPGEEVVFTDPPDAGNNYGDFMRQQLTAICAAADVPYEVLTGDLRGVSDRAIRVVLNEWRRRIEMRQFGIFVHQFCRPARNEWLDAAWLSGALSLPGYGSNPRPYRRTRWTPQGWPYLHPVQDVQADKLAVRAGFTSRSEVVLRRGYDPDAVDDENASDNARADDLGLRYDSDARIRDASGKTIPDEGNP